MEHSGTGRHECARYADWIVAIVGFALEIALQQPNDTARPEIDRRQHIEPQVAAPLLPW
jgi:hypothetical protein